LGVPAFPIPRAENDNPLKGLGLGGRGSLTKKNFDRGKRVSREKEKRGGSRSPPHRKKGSSQIRTFTCDREKRRMTGE